MPNRIVALRDAMVPLAVAALVVLGLSESGSARRGLRCAEMSAAPWKTSALCLRSGSSGMQHERVAWCVGATHGTRGHWCSPQRFVSGLATYAVSATWPGKFAAAVLLGLGGGLLHSTLNANAAHHFSAGGATLGPVVMAVAASGGWQAGVSRVRASPTADGWSWFVSRRRWPGASEETVPAHRHVDLRRRGDVLPLHRHRGRCRTGSFSVAPRGGACRRGRRGGAAEEDALR